MELRLQGVFAYGDASIRSCMVGDLALDRLDQATCQTRCCMMGGVVAAAARERWHRYLRHNHHNQHRRLLPGLLEDSCVLLQAPLSSNDHIAPLGGCA